MKNDAQVIYAFCVPLIFPEGFSVGSSGKNNRIEIEYNGRGNPVLRGTSIAGVFRSELDFDEELDYYFGRALDREQERQESRMVFFDLEFNKKVEESAHNLISRHTGSISTPDNGLFFLERVASGSTADLRFFFRAEKDWKDHNERFLDALTRLLQRGISFGGNQARGMGRAVINGKSFQRKTFDLETEDGLAGFLDLLYTDGQWELEGGEAIPATAPALDDNLFEIEIAFGIPRGQDVLCSEGNDAYPVTVEKSDSGKYWKIPGSSIRGVFRAWFSRLAARDGEKLSDSAENYRNTPAQRVVDRKVVQDDPIVDLFGVIGKDGQKKGRIHITDAFSNETVKEPDIQAEIECLKTFSKVMPKRPEPDVQYRAHVAIDSFSGGTNPGRLFTNYVLINNKLEFRTRLSIKSPDQGQNQKEIDWLKKTLQAVQLGLVRFGSSKASGRLEIRDINVICKPEGIDFKPEDIIPNNQIERN